MSLVIIKFFISVLLTISILIVKHLHSKNIKLPNHLIFFLIFRIIPFLILYYILNYDIQSDVRSFYHQAYSAKSGLWIYKDFRSSHSFFFPYILSIPLYIYNSGKLIIIFLSILELLTVVLLEKIAKFSNFNYLSIIYWLLPSQFIFTIFGGQEDFLLFSFFLPILYFINKSEQKLGVLAAISFYATKLIYSLPIISVFLLIKNKLSFILTFSIVFISISTLLYLKVGTSLLMPLEESSRMSPPNIWHLILPFTKGTILNYLNIISFISISCVPFITYLLVKKNIFVLNTYTLSCIFIIVYSLFMILSPKTWGYYFGIFSIPLVFFILEKQFNTIIITSFLMGLHPSFWYRLGRPYYNSFKMLSTNFIYIFEYTLSLILIILLIYTIWNTILLLKKSNIYK